MRREFDTEHKMVNVMLSDSLAMKTMLLRVKRMVMRSGEGQDELTRFVANWFNDKGYDIVIPIPDLMVRLCAGCYVSRNGNEPGSIYLEIEFPSLTLYLYLVETRTAVKAGPAVTETLRTMVFDVLKTNLLYAEVLPFSDSEVAGELMEFIYDYSDFEVEDV